VLTDEELVDLVARHYDGVGRDISLESVERRGRQRRRNTRIATGTAVVAVVMVVAGATAFATSRIRTASPADISTACDSRYESMSDGRNDRPLLPARLPAPIIDMHRGAAELRLYAATVKPPDPDVPNLLIDEHEPMMFDCSRTAGGAISAHLTVGVGIDATALGDGRSDDYYRDYLPDGSGALVGEVMSPTTSVTVRTAGGAAVPVAFAHGFFVAWSSTGDLDGAEVSFFSSGDPHDPAVSTEPTTLSGTFDPQAFGAACVASFTKPSTSSTPDYVGPLTPAIEITHGDEVAWVYAGNSTEVCDFESTDHSRGIAVYGSYEGKKSAYGMQSFVGNDSGLVVGRVPATVTGVRIVTSSGQVIPAQTADGVFAAWVTDGVYGSKHTSVIATSSAEMYTIIGSRMTSKPR
jgi:hypothetical protein